MRLGMKHNGRIVTLLALLTVLAFPAAMLPVAGQSAQQPAIAPESQQGGDLIRQLNLTPEQREQIRSIRQGNQAERVAVNQRLRETNQALEEALDSDTPDEAIVEQRVRDVAAAQTSAMRIRILTEIKVRRVLTAEQRTILRSLQRQALDLQRERRLANPDERKKEERSRSLQNRNGLGPLFPRRVNQRRPRL
jgi:Spy/CpxP family protein refolding chaperone